MKKPFSQIGLFDFMAEPEQPRTDAPVQEEAGQIQPLENNGVQAVETGTAGIGGAGVGVRLKSLKTESPVVEEQVEARMQVGIETQQEKIGIQDEMEGQTGIETPQEIESQDEIDMPEPEPAEEVVEIRAQAPPIPGKSKRGRKSLKQSAAEADLIDIPDDETLFLKQYYTMGEVAGMFRVNQSLIRFWETEFNILQPRKNKKGDRHFRPIDIKNLHLIYHLLRQRKYTIEGAKDFLKKNKKAEERFEAVKKLQQVKSFLLEWKAQL